MWAVFIMFEAFESKGGNLVATDPAFPLSRTWCAPAEAAEPASEVRSEDPVWAPKADRRVDIDAAPPDARHRSLDLPIDRPP